MIFRETDGEYLEEVLSVLDNTNRTNKPLINRKFLETGVKSLDGRAKDLLSDILSYSIQVLSRPLQTRYNDKTIKDIHLDIANIYLDDIFNGRDSTVKTVSLPMVLQRLLQYCVDFRTLKVRAIDVSSIIKLRPFTYDSIKCKRCGAITETEGICDDCFVKIEEATEFRTESFVTSGTSLGDFELTFNDWRVIVTGNKYFFKKLNESNTRYQPKLPFEEYQKLLQLI